MCRLVLFPTLLLALAAGCGGGGTTPVLGTAALSGQIYELDGQTLDRSGVTVTLLETGQSAVTGPDGGFGFGAVPAGTATLAFSASPAALAQAADDNGVDPAGSESEFEDEHGNPVVSGIAAGDAIDVRCAMSGGRVTELRVSADGRVRADARLTRAATSPDPDVEGRVRVESRPDRERFSIEAERLDPGTVVEFFVDGTSLGTVAALADGRAELERNTHDGDALPLGAAAVSELAGLRVEVRLAATGELMLEGAVPDAPASGGGDGGLPLDRARGRAPLVPFVAGAEGSIEIRRRTDLQLFRMEAQNLEPGLTVTFRIEDPAGGFATLATLVTDGAGQAEISTQDGLPLPLGVADVAELTGLEVQVVAGEELLLSGFVPPLAQD